MAGGLGAGERPKMGKPRFRVRIERWDGAGGYFLESRPEGKFVYE
jgi:hypothetical protein